MSDILDTLKTYPDDPTVVMSRRVVNETIAEIERLRAELAALRENSLAILTRVRGYRDKVITERDALLVQRNDAMAAVSRAIDMKIAAEAERDELRALLKEARWSVEHCRLLKLLARIDAALNKGGADE